ncbi:MAG: hypothetical protein NT069_28810 [Planctomycetota bacterium]|nr:hypothetical protein [Planctomycetota bacterium]
MNTAPHSLRRFVVAPLAFIALLTSRLSAAEPVLRDVNLRGMQIGGTTTLVVDGEDFGAAPRLLLPFPAQVDLKPGTTPQRATFDVTLATDVVPGYYNLRVVTDGGITTPIVIGVDTLPQRLLTPKIDALPAALHFSVNGSSVVETRFQGKAGERILVEVEAQRLGSKLRPIIHLYDARRKQLHWAWANPSLAGDARIDAKLPADGEYTIAVHDVEYSTPGPGYCRLKVGNWSYVDQVYPPVIGSNLAQRLEILGDASSAIDVEGAATSGPLPIAWPTPALASGPRPFVSISPFPEFLEQALPSTTTGAESIPLQTLAAGRVGVCGRLLSAGEEDRYRIPVTARTRLKFDLFAERIGSPLDAALVIRNDKGDLLARADDSPGTIDPILEFVVPDSMTMLTVGIHDSQGREGVRGIYRLVVEPQLPTEKSGDFRLSTPTQRVILPVGGRSVMPVWVDRSGGNNDAIEIAATGLPAGVRLHNTHVPAGAEGTLVTLERTATGEGPVSPQWRGTSTGGVERPVAISVHPMARLQPWLATEIPVAPSTNKASDFQIDWPGIPDSVGITPTVRLPLPVKVTRPMGDMLVRLTLLTSQLPLFTNGQPDLGRMLRQEQPVELAANVLEGTLNLVVPAGLFATGYDLSIQAELRSADRRLVLATAFTPVRRIPVKLPVAIRLKEPRIEAALDSKQGATVAIQGAVERLDGAVGDVPVQLTGLPPGARADAVNVKADATEFTINLILPANQPVGEIHGIKLSGTLPPDPKQPNVRVKSRDVELQVVVKIPAVVP